MGILVGRNKQLEKRELFFKNTSFLFQGGTRKSKKCQRYRLLNVENVVRAFSKKFSPCKEGISKTFLLLNCQFSKVRASSDYPKNNYSGHYSLYLRTNNKHRFLAIKLRLWGCRGFPPRQDSNQTCTKQLKMIYKGVRGFPPEKSLEILFLEVHKNFGWGGVQDQDNRNVPVLIHYHMIGPFSSTVNSLPLRLPLYDR